MKTQKLEQELNTSLMIFEVLGLQYFSLKALKKENVNVRPSFFRFLYMLVLCGVVTTLMVCFIFYRAPMMEKKVTPKNALMFAMQNMISACIILVVCVSFFQSFASTSLVKKIFLNSQEIADLSFNEFRIFIDVNRMKKATWRRFSVMLVFLATVHGTITSAHIKTMQDILFMLILILPIIFLMMISFKLVFYVRMLNIELKILKNILEEINSQLKRCQPLTLVMTTMKSIEPFDDCSRKLNVARRIYNLIYENGILINSSNGLTILILLMTLVVSLTASGYELFVIIVGGLPQEGIIFTLYYIIFSSAILIASVAYCQQTQGLMTTLATSCNRIASESHHQLRLESREILQNFFIQLIHQPVTFTAFGFYTMNLSLLASIMTGTISYQIILIQFYAS